MGPSILKLDKDRKILNADVNWTQQFDQKSAGPVQKHVNKCEQRIIPEHNRNYVMNDIQPYQLEPEGTLEEDDDSDHF